MKEEKKFTEMTCKFCGNEWKYKGDKKWATCSSCQNKTKTKIQEGEA